MGEKKRSIGSVKLSEKLSPEMTQSELAERLKVTPQAVSNWVCGRAIPSRETAFEIESLLGIPARSWFEAGDGEAA